MRRAIRVGATGDDRANLDLVGVLYHLAVGEELVASDDHCGVGQNAQLRQETTHGASPRDLDRAPLRVEVNPHARKVG
jgi:hypothetical protein